MLFCQFFDIFLVGMFRKDISSENVGSYVSYSGYPVTNFKTTNPVSKGKKITSWSSIQFLKFVCFCQSGFKVQLFWEGHKNLRNRPYGFDVY